MGCVDGYVEGGEGEVRGVWIGSIRGWSVGGCDSGFSDIHV